MQLLVDSMSSELVRILYFKNILKTHIQFDFKWMHMAKDFIFIVVTG